MSAVAKSASSGVPKSWSPEQLRQIEQIKSRYPTQKAAIMPLLWLA